MYGVYGSVRQPKASKQEFPSSTSGSSCFYLVFINNLINDKSKYKNKMLLFVLYGKGPLIFIYNLYKSMTSRRDHLYRYLYCMQYIYIFMI